jgi:hypothetical protein
MYVLIYTLIYAYTRLSGLRLPGLAQGPIAQRGSFAHAPEADSSMRTLDTYISMRTLDI